MRNFMKRQICIVLAIFIGGMPHVAAAAEPDAEARATARLILSVERPLAERDVKNYCAAVYGTPDYAGFVMRACQAGVKSTAKKPEDCSEANIKQVVKNDVDRCLGMTAEQFDATVKRWAGMRGGFLKDMAAKGVDGEKVLKEERAKLR
jgi:hypothetical protein